RLRRARLRGAAARAVRGVRARGDAVAGRPRADATAPTRLAGDPAATRRARARAPRDPRRARRGAARRAGPPADQHDAPPHPAVAASGAALPALLGEPRADPGARGARRSRTRRAAPSLRAGAALPALGDAALPGDARDDRGRAARGDPAP